MPHLIRPLQSFHFPSVPSYDHIYRRRRISTSQVPLLLLIFTELAIPKHILARMLSPFLFFFFFALVSKLGNFYVGVKLIGIILGSSK